MKNIGSCSICGENRTSNHVCSLLRSKIKNKMKKKFLIFCGERFYANGGANDLVSITPQTKEEAIKYAKSLIGKEFSTNYWMEEDGELYLENTVEWVQVFDLETCEIIFKEGKVYGDASGIVII